MMNKYDLYGAPMRLFSYGEELAVVIPSNNGEETAFKFEGATIESFSVDVAPNYIDVTCIDHDSRNFLPIGTNDITINVSFRVYGKQEVIHGKDLTKDLDPVLSKSILELAKIINEKLKEPIR